MEFPALHSQCILLNGEARRAGCCVNLNLFARGSERAHPKEWYLVKT